MKNFRIDYIYDGYRFYDVVRAENAQQAIDYLTYADDMRHACKAKETDEAPTYIVPEGWSRPVHTFEPLTEEELEESDEYLALLDTLL